MTGLIFDIKHFAIHDGPGVRSTVFFSGCPLRCVWCHNPESYQRNTKLGFFGHKCVSCGKCVAACPNAAHSISHDGVHHFDRERCTVCGKCTEVCPVSALTVYGKNMTIDEVLEDVLQDRGYYELSDGGVTLSGGECTMHAEFCLELLRRLKEENIHTAVDTCGFVKQSVLESIAPYTDLFLYDLKAFDEETHIRCTGISNKQILENLQYLDSVGKSVEIRIPFVPRYNDGEIEKIGTFLMRKTSIRQVRLLPYHNYAGSKFESLGLENTLPERLPSPEEIQKAEGTLAKLGLTCLK